MSARARPVRAGPRGVTAAVREARAGGGGAARAGPLLSGGPRRRRLEQPAGASCSPGSRASGPPPLPCRRPHCGLVRAALGLATA